MTPPPAPAPKRLWLAAALVLALAGAGLWLWQNHPAKQVRTNPQALPPAGPGQLQHSEEAPRHLPGDEILKNYASSRSTPQRDLEAMAHVFSNLRLLVKGDSPFHLGANEEFAAALLGKNKGKLAFVSAKSPIFNDKGQLVDRWQTPLYFHAAAQDRIEIRSAGPDRKMWTEDDLHRVPNGEFLKGAALGRPSLFETKQPKLQDH